MIQAGTYITDGNCIWIIDDIRQGSVGDIKYSLVVPDGYLKLNGATINKTEYPRLLKYVLDNNLYTTTSTNYILFYIESNNATTFRLPNYLNRCLEGGDAINFLNAGLPNITGTYSHAFVGILSLQNTDIHGENGAIYAGTSDGALQGSGAGLARSGFNFDASRCSSIYGNSTTVQPNAILLYPCIKY